jgi:hypothetical protein
MKMTIKIVAKRDRHVFEVLPRRWVVERTFAWISKHRRAVLDYESLPASHEAMILWAMIVLMTHRLTQAAELSDSDLGPAGPRWGLAVSCRNLFRHGVSRFSDAGLSILCLQEQEFFRTGQST